MRQFFFFAEKFWKSFNMLRFSLYSVMKVAKFGSFPILIHLEISSVLKYYFPIQILTSIYYMGKGK